jgi:hypothetical protein
MPMLLSLKIAEKMLFFFNLKCNELKCFQLGRPIWFMKDFYSVAKGPKFRPQNTKAADFLADLSKKGEKGPRFSCTLVLH